MQSRVRLRWALHRHGPAGRTRWHRSSARWCWTSDNAPSSGRALSCAGTSGRCPGSTAACGRGGAGSWATGVQAVHAHHPGQATAQAAQRHSSLGVRLPGERRARLSGESRAGKAAVIAAAHCPLEDHAQHRSRKPEGSGPSCISSCRREACRLPRLQPCCAWQHGQPQPHLDCQQAGSYCGMESCQAVKSLAQVGGAVPRQTQGMIRMQLVLDNASHRSVAAGLHTLGRGTDSHSQPAVRTRPVAPQARGSAWSCPP